MEIQIKIIGYTFILLALIHAIFPKYFNWKEELKHLSLINKEMMEIHTLFIAITVFLMGILCITSSTELVGTNLGNRICLGMGIFWAIRLLLQFFGYSSELWRGKLFETIVHIIFSIFWTYITFIFLNASTFISFL